MQATVGNKVQDNEILLLRCSDGYEVLGTEKKEDGVSCKLGKWSHELHCEPGTDLKTTFVIQICFPSILLIIFSKINI